MTKTFQIGQTYSTRSICDHECVFTFTVKARSAKFVTLLQHNVNRTRRVGIWLWNGSEACSPLGRYSMAPILDAGDFA